MRLIVVSGKPGAGKGTKLGEFMKEREDEYVVISPGAMLRKEVAEQTEIGLKVSAIMQSGELVSDDLINQIIFKAISEAEKNVILDGYPRTVAQSTAMIENGYVPDKVINISIDDEIVLGRAADRIVCAECSATYSLGTFKKPKKEGICDKCGGKLVRRADDKPEVVKNRLKVYADDTDCAIKYLKTNHAGKFIDLVDLGKGVDDFEKSILD